MNESLQRWREDFLREPDSAFDRLVRGVVPLGAAGQLSFGEILDGLFEPGDPILDTAAANWLGKRILGTIPDGSTLNRWVLVLEEYFRGIAAMELPKTGEVLRRQHKRLRLWLSGFYEGPDRDPEGSYLLALARAQADQQFSTLWRRLVLGEEMTGRSYLAIGILGFRKMPEQDGRESSDVPEGLLQALVELSKQSGTGKAKWTQTMRSLFATYRRSERYWVEHLAPLLPHYQQQSSARDWLSGLLPEIPRWRPPAFGSQVNLQRASKVSYEVVQSWVTRVRKNSEVCSTPEFSAFLDHHRAYAETTGDPEYINKTFNNLATSIIRKDGGRPAIAVSLIEEALRFAPWDPRNWISYAIVLNAAHRADEAIAALWNARHRFAFEPFIRNELGRLLRENGDLSASEGVFREAVSHFPGDVVCRTGLAETLRAMSRLDEAREVYAQACRDFPSNHFCRNGLAETLREMQLLDEAHKVYQQACRDFPNDNICRSGLADLLIDLNEIDEAESIYREDLRIDGFNRYARSGLARVLSIRSARNGSLELRDEAKEILQGLADEGVHSAKSGLRAFDGQWERARIDPSVTFRRDTNDRQPQARQEPNSSALTEMSVAELLGRAMIALWQAERADDEPLRSSLCAHATNLLDIPEEKIDDDLLAAFVETRGLVLLASGDAQRARAYFEEQILHYGRGGWIGVRLGEQRVRILLGERTDDEDNAAAPMSQSARFALYVAMVIQKLSFDPQESAVQTLLKCLYPDVAKFATRARTDALGGLSIESGEAMLGAFLQTRWFRPAGIQTVDDLERPDALSAVVERIISTRIDTFDVISNSTMALAA